MTGRKGWGWAGIAILFLALATPVLAGGWAVVTLDAWPESPRAGTPISLGFMVLQHGKTPIDNNPFEGEPLKPLLIAINNATGDKLEIEARKEGPLGHFVVDVTFPTPGTWLLEIVPPPFAGTTFEPLTVQPAATRAATEKQTSAENPANAIAAAAVEPQLPLAAQWLLILGILVIGIGLTLGIRSIMSRHPRTAALQKQREV